MSKLWFVLAEIVLIVVGLKMCECTQTARVVISLDCCSAVRSPLVPKRMGSLSVGTDLAPRTPLSAVGQPLCPYYFTTGSSAGELVQPHMQKS